MMKPPLISRVCSDRVRPAPVTMAVVLWISLSIRVPTLDLVISSGRPGARSFTRASLAAMTTCLPTVLRSFWEKMICSFPEELASRASRVSHQLADLSLGILGDFGGDFFDSFHWLLTRLRR